MAILSLSIGILCLTAPGISASKTPRFPKWWTDDKPGQFVGISPAVSDKDLGRRIAILNAAALYAHATSNDMRYQASYAYEANLEMDGKNWQYAPAGGVMGQLLSDSFQFTGEQTYLLNANDFGMEILDEYRNDLGEYFVKCAFTETPEVPNAFKMYWKYKDKMADEDADGTISYSMALMAPGIGLDNVICWDGEIKWQEDSVRYRYSMDNVPIYDYAYRTDDTQVRMKDHTLAGGPGLVQARLLGALPVLPDSMDITVTTMESLSPITQSGNVEHMICRQWVAMGQAPSIPRRLMVTGYRDGRYEVSVADASTCCEGKPSEVVTGFTEGLILEHDKNAALLDAISQYALTLSDRKDTKSATTTTIRADDLTLPGDDIMKSMVMDQFTVSLRPVWYLDPEHTGQPATATCVSVIPE